MKRAIFKLGKILYNNDSTRGRSILMLQLHRNGYPKSENWRLPITRYPARGDEPDGTSIRITDFNEGIAMKFGENVKDFKRDLTKKVQTHYGFIIDKGFQAKINGNVVEGKTTELIFTAIEDSENVLPAIRPYCYKTEANGVSIFLECWFCRAQYPPRKKYWQSSKKGIFQQRRRAGR